MTERPPASGTPRTKQRLLMCSPAGFAVNYEINPWMTGQVGRVSRSLAAEQWLGLREQLAILAETEVMPADPDWPDLVFTANAGLPIPDEKIFVLASFRFPQRQGETAITRRWFEARGWRCVELEGGVYFEGAGDALLDANGRLFVADGPRTERAAADHLARWFKGPVHSLRLVDPHYYHLDTCFCPLARGYALYLPGAFDAASIELLHRCFGERLIGLTPEEGRLFCANAVNVDDAIVMNAPTPRLVRLLGECGFRPTATPLSEFMKSGGSAKCLTLRIA